MYKKIIYIFLFFSIIFNLNINAQTNTNQNTTNFFNAPLETLNTTNDEPAILTDIRNMQNQATISTTSMFIRAIIGFIVTLVGIYLVYIFFKKRSKKVLGSDNVIKVLATTLVAPNKYVSIIEVAGDMYLIGVADHNINLISKIENKETRDNIVMSYAVSKENVVEDNFKTMFDKMLNVIKPKEKDPIETSKEIRERLEKLNSKNKKDE